MFSEKYLAVVKEANAAMEAARPPIMASVAPLLGVAALLSGVHGVAGYLRARSAVNAQRDALNGSFKALQGMPEYKDNAMIGQRFSELALISPTLASNPNIAHKVISSRIQDGFSVDDIHRLASIEHLTSTAHKPMGGEGAFTHGLIAARDQFDRRMSDMAPAIGAISAKDADWTASAYPMPKRGMGFQMKHASEDIFSEQTLSDECIGKMMGTRHGMIKEAGILNAIKGGVGESAKATGKYFSMMSVPIALGLGMAALNKIMKVRENNQMSAQADHVYKNIMSSSDIAKQNPQAAAEAFDSLRSFAPILATKHNVAKSFIEEVAGGWGGKMPPQTIGMLAEVQQKAMGMHDDKGFFSALKEPMQMFNLRLPGQKDDDHKPEDKRNMWTGKRA
jgi:hypothetical protein